MSIGFVYCLTNSSMPGICKIGRTDRSPSQRCKELSASTSAPTEFHIEFYAEVEDSALLERDIHAAFSKFRVNESREFFTCSPGLAFHWLQCNAELLTYCLNTDIWAQQDQLRAEGGLVLPDVSNVIRVNF
ncbi:GIY-YIG nuclease family protein [Pseudomonas lactis]|uniref:GIY-YIG nuclease family protein n=1 Tax=Pseudomonas lactis TaxID=1615674 RepID=UPI0028A22ED1|nr:GIY-YIG nuclease family protein [Pseudomonas lactis]